MSRQKSNHVEICAVGIMLTASLAATANHTVIVKPKSTYRTDFSSFRLRYGIVDLGTLGGASQAHAINNRGQVVGESETVEPKPGEEAETHAFLWNNGRMHDLGALPESESEVHTSKAFALNNRGSVVGGSGSYEPVGPDMGVFASASPFLYKRGRMRLLGRTKGGLVPFGEACGINDRGDVIGSNGGGAYLWRKGCIMLLGTLQKGPSEISPTEQESGAHAINNKGQVVGYAVADSKRSVTHPFLWQNGRMTDLGTPSGATDGSAAAINDLGDVVGTASDPSRRSGVWWWRRGQLHILSNLARTQISSVCGVNDSLQIVGRCDQRAVLWERGQPYDLNELILPGSGWQLMEATGINNRGQIAGNGLHNGKRRAFLMTPMAAKHQQRGV